MQTLLKYVPEKIWKRKVMLLSFFLFAGCTQHDESLMPEKPAISAAQSQDVAECGSKTSQITNGDAKITILEGLAGSALSEIELTSLNASFTAHLSADSEVPANDSNGQGQVLFMLNEDETVLNYKLNVANTKNVTQAHIHCGEAGVNGPIVVFLFGLDPAGVNQNGVLAEGTITAANIIARPESAACVGGLSSFENLLEKMRNGGAYVNVHTLALPGGEIRGQILK